MRFSKKFLFTALSIVVVYAAYFFTRHVSSTPHQVLGTHTNLVLFEEPQDGRAPLLTAIQHAQKEILVEVYLLSDAQVITALESSKARGVSVKVMMEEHPFGGGNNGKTFARLQKDSIPVEWANGSSFALTHEKAIVIDNSIVFILNQNLTNAAFSKNREYDIEDTNATDVTEVRNIFIADWERKNFAPTDNNLVISPVTSRQELTSLIQGATKEIDMEIEDIDDKQIVELLSQKASHLPVNVIVPTLSQIASNKAALSLLQQAGAKVKMISSPYIHAKLIVVDTTKAYVGSVNLSSQSMDENRELGIIISQNDIVQKLSQDFSNDFQKN